MLRVVQGEAFPAESFLPAWAVSFPLSPWHRAESCSSFLPASSWRCSAPASSSAVFPPCAFVAYRCYGSTSPGAQSLFEGGGLMGRGLYATKPEDKLHSCRRNLLHEAALLWRSWWLDPDRLRWPRPGLHRDGRFSSAWCIQPVCCRAALPGRAVEPGVWGPCLPATTSTLLLLCTCEKVRVMGVTRGDRAGTVIIAWLGSTLGALLRLRYR